VLHYDQIKDSVVNSLLMKSGLLVQSDGV